VQCAKQSNPAKNIHVKVHALAIMKFVEKNLSVLLVCMECWLNGSNYHELIQALACIPDHQ